MTTPEGRVAAYLTRRVKELGGRQRKVAWEGRVGAPDRLILFPGVAAFIELKSTKGKPTALQLREMEILRRAGCNVYLCYGEDDVDAALKNIWRMARRQGWLNEGEDETF